MGLQPATSGVTGRARVKGHDDPRRPPQTSCNSAVVATHQGKLATSARRSADVRATTGPRRPYSMEDSMTDDAPQLSTAALPLLGQLKDHPRR